MQRCRTDIAFFEGRISEARVELASYCRKLSKEGCNELGGLTPYCKHLRYSAPWCVNDAHSRPWESL